MIYAYGYENARDLNKQQGVVNFARLRTKRLTLTTPACAFERMTIDSTSGDMVVDTDSKETSVVYTVIAEAYNVVTFLGHRATPKYQNPSPM